MALANVTLTNTFDEWRVRTNQIIYKQDELDGNVANALIGVSSNTANALNYANSSFLRLSTGNTVTGNVLFSGVYNNTSSNVHMTGNVSISGRSNVTGNIAIFGIMNLRSNIVTTGAGDIIIDLLG
jgi:hypothetical protein